MKNVLKNLAGKLSSTKAENQEPQPQFFDLSKEHDQRTMEGLLEERPEIKIVDTYKTQLEELMVLEQPELYAQPKEREEAFAQYAAKHFTDKSEQEAGVWVYLPWRNILLHVLEDESYLQVRTGRNRDVITKKEQEKFYNSTIAIAGLSVGNSVAMSIVLSGGGKNLRLADFDDLELTNLNRIRGSLADLTSPKTHMTAQQIYEMDPFANVKLYSNGVNPEMIEEFIDGADLVIDEMDDFAMKMLLRKEAQKKKIPVLMATDNGEGGLIDIERYDERDDVKPFHGRGPDPNQPPPKNIPRKLMGMMIAQSFVGLDITEMRMFDTLESIGDSVPTWPQLGTAALLNGVVAAVAARRILTAQETIDHRAVYSPTQWLQPNWGSDEEKQEHVKRAEKFMQNFQDGMSSIS